MTIIEQVAKSFDHFQIVPKKSINLSPDVRKMCETNSCGNYGRTWTCPPALAPLEEIQKNIKRFDHFVLVYQIYPLEDRMDWEGMMAGAEDFNSRLITLQAKLKDQQSFLILGAGSCTLCKKCTYPETPCRRPDEAIVSAEAYGIDVMKLMRDNGLNYNNGPDTVTYIGGVLY